MLTDAKIKKLRPQDKRYRVHDADGLSLSIWPTGRMSWILRYQVNGVRRDLTLGKYPALSLREARTKVAELRLSLDRGENIHVQQAGAVLFSEVADMLLAQKESKAARKTAENARARMQRFILPKLGNRPISEISASEVRALVGKLTDEGKQETAFRVRCLINQVFALAIGRELTENDPMGRIKVKKSQTKHYPHIADPVLLGRLLRDMDVYRGDMTTIYALRLLPHIFIRSAELRFLRYEYLDFDAALIRIPGELMKMGRPHLVPMSRQVMALLDDYFAFAPREGYLFPTVTRRSKQMSPVLSPGTLRKALMSLGYSGEVIVPHGFRGTASTFLHEMGYDHKVIEKQLAHEEKRQEVAAYNHAEYLPARREMMQGWSDFLDKCKNGGS